MGVTSRRNGLATGLAIVAAMWFAALPPAAAAWPAPRPLDEGRLAAAGLRVVHSTHATLVTDAAPSDAIDGLPRLIDLAVPQWAGRFGVSASEPWRLRVYLIEDEARFRARGLWPEQSPGFPHGLSLGYEVWLRQQSADYYRRHLLLHEATHGFMSTRLGSCGPGWYMEGMAELCGTHAWDGESLRLAVIPESREAAPDWGRVRLIRDAVAAGRVLSIDAVTKIDNRVVLDAESYAWVWALCWFLDNHPSYQERFRGLPAAAGDPRFDDRFRTLYERDRRGLDQEWRLFVNTLVYGHDLAREAIEFSVPAKSRSGNGSTTRVRADRGWQASGLRVEAGQAYRLTARGRFTIGRETDGTPWPCEPNGVTLDWNAGQPVGRLLATIDAGPDAFVDATPIGLGADYTAPATGQLFLRLNDVPNALADNGGEAIVQIKKTQKASPAPIPNPQPLTPN